MAKKRLNKKVALIGSAVFVFVIILAIAVFLFLSRNPQKFINDGNTAAEAARQAADQQQRKDLYEEAERNYKKAYGLAKTDELKVEMLHRLADVFMETEKWREVLGCWTQIVRLDPQDMGARYNRLIYFYIIAQASPGMLWQEVTSQASEFIEMVESPQASPELATTDTSKWAIDALKQKGETTHRLDPYLHLIRGVANLSITQLGMVTNKEETLKQAIADLEKVKQLEPTNAEVYLHLAQAAALRGEIEALKGNTDAREEGRNEAVELLKEGVVASKDGIEANINLLEMKHRLIQVSSDPNQRKRILALEPEYLALATKFSSSADAFLALSVFYSDFRLGPTYLDKAIEAIDKARGLDNNNVNYLLNAANLYSRRFNIRKQKGDLDKAVEIAKNALLLPDTQKTTGPQSAMARAYQVRLNSLLANSYIDQILDSTGPLGESEGQQLLTEAQQVTRQIEQIFGSGDDPQVVKWQGMVELAAARLGKGDASAAIRKLYKTYTQLKASERSDMHLSYELAKVFVNSSESGAVAEFLANAIENGIEALQPEARLDYAEILSKARMWKAVLAHINLFEERYGVTDRSRMLRIGAHIGAMEFADAERYLEQAPQQDPNWMMLKVAVLEGKSRQIRTIINRREAKARTTAVPQKTPSQQPQEAVDQRSDEQLAAEMKGNLSVFIEYMDKLLVKDPNALGVDVVASLCDDAIATGRMDQANLIVDKFLKYKPSNPVVLFYKRRLGEPEPAKISTERWKQIREEVLLGITDPVARATNLGVFYQMNGEPNKAMEQFKKLAGISAGAETLQADEALRARAAGFLFDTALGEKNWEVADKVAQLARQENIDNCSGDFFAARVSLAKGQYETALASIESALTQRPVFGYGYLLKSRINAELGNEAAALTDIQTAATINPLDSTIAREFANRLYIRNQKLKNNVSSAQLTEAKRVLDWAMALNPGDLELMSFYAEYISESEPERALALRQALQQNAPSVQNALLLTRLATRLALDSTDTQQRQALFGMAASALEQAKSYDPQNPVVLESYAEYYRQTGQQEKAEQLLTTTKESRLLWRYYLRAGRYEDAKKVLEQSYEANPRDVNVLRGLLFLAERVADKKAVTEYAERLLSADETAENHLLLVQTYLNTGLVKEAEQKLASFRERYPTDGRGLLLGAWLSMKQGRLKEALDLTNKRLEGDQSDATAWRLRGQTNLMLADYDQAITDLKRSKTLLDSAATRILLAKAYLRAGRTDDAITELKNTTDDPQAPDEARSLLERIYLSSGQKETLKNFYAKLLEQLPENIYWHNRAAGFANMTDDFAKAEQLYDLALRKSKERGQENVEALGGYLRALLAAGKMDKLFEEGGKYVDGNLAPVAYFRMAEGKMKLGDRATAIQYCTKAVDKAGDNTALAAQVVEKMYALLGEQDAEQVCKQKLTSEPEAFSGNWTMYNLFRLKGDYNKALEYIDKCLKTTSPDQAQWLDLTMQKAEVLILAFYKTSDNNYLKRAMEAYESLLVKMPNNTSILNNVAYILAENNQDIDKALEYAKRAYEAKPNDPGYLDTYAFVLYKKGRYSEAVQFERAAIQQYEAQRISTPVDAYEHLGQSHEQLGELTQARAAYEQALEAGGENIQKPVKERITAAIERLGKQKGD
jgi:tetratricopeptide (TPR) repeat protein